MRVLVIDDSRAMRMILARELRDVAVVDEVAEADSAEAAIDVLGSLPIDLVICDWNMAGMTGMELLEALRAAGWTVPFGFVTSEPSELAAPVALASGAAFLLRKPFAGEALRAQVAAVLEGRIPAAMRAAGLEADAPLAGPDDEAALERTEELQALFEGLLRKPVTVAPAPAGPPRQAPRLTAEYVDGSGGKVALCVVEAPLASALSAALTKLPAALADEWASSGALPDLLSENFHEVANVMSKVVRAGERCSLGAIAGFAPGEQLPDIEAISAARRSESFEMAVDGYGAGLLSLVTL